MAKSLAGWMEVGYGGISPCGDSVSDLKAWRFWARGPSRGQICCGILRDSADRFGRPYPLLVAGTGPLPGWEEAWDLLPIVLEKNWQQMDRLTTRSFGLLRELEDELRGFSEPAPEWVRFRAERDEMTQAETTSLRRIQALFENLRSWSFHPDRKTEMVILVNDSLSLEPMVVFSLWHMVLKNEGYSTIPNAVFLGGPQIESFLVLFRRALVPEDFHKLWSVKPQNPKTESLSKT
jgi:type VI secretion system protein VasJ